MNDVTDLLNTEAWKTYVSDLEKLTDDQLDEEVIKRRAEMAECDRQASERREAGQPLDDKLADTMGTIRTMLNLVEHEKGMRLRPEFGSCPMDWPEE